jgi:hypothetical protein
MRRFVVRETSQASGEQLARSARTGVNADGSHRLLLGGREIKPSRGGCDDPVVSAPDDESLEAKLRAIAEEISGSLERAVEQFDLNEIADRIGISSERARELADLAGEWFSHQFPMSEASRSSRQPQAGEQSGERSSRHDGPRPLDVPTEEQGLALSALDSGRWRVDPGTEELIPVGSGPSPSQPVGLVGELRARDWIAPSGEVTLVGRDALRRWLNRANPS